MTEKILNKTFYNLLNKHTSKLQDYEHSHTHIYTDEQGHFIFAKPRLKNLLTGDKWIRSFSLDYGGEWQMKEPDYKSAYPMGEGKKPLYLLPTLTDKATDDEPVYIFEGEQKADLANKLGLIATTSGGSSTIDKYHWQPLAGRRVILWCDYDKAGFDWLQRIGKKLNAIQCNISIIDTDKLGLNQKDDIVDWANRIYADGEDDTGVLEAIKNLPTMSSEQVLDLITEQTEPNTSIAPNKPQGELLEPPLTYENGQFELYYNGLFFVAYDDDGEPKYTTKICSYIKVVARSRDKDSNAWGTYLQWNDRAGKPHQWAMPDYHLHGTAKEYIKELADKGLVINTEQKAQRYLGIYLNNHTVSKEALCVDKLGWHDGVYLLPNQTIGDNNSLVVYQPQRPINHGYNSKGTLNQWREQISQPMQDQTRIVFALSCSFAGQLMTPLSYEGGGFHIVGNSSTGKSTGLIVAGSVWGKPKDFIKRWNTTKNGLEGLATAHNDCFLGLDEISEMQPKDISKAIYMLANEQGKTRSTTSGINRANATWKTLFLSNGEETLTSYMKKAGETANAGLLTRLIHIDNDAGKGYNGFDSVVLSDTAEEQSNILKQLSSQYYGTAGIAWLEYLTSDLPSITAKAKKMIDCFMMNYTNLKSQAYRTAQRFALVAVAGELASEQGITGWEAGKATLAVKSCLTNWIENNGTTGNHEQSQMLNKLLQIMEGESWKFDKWVKRINSQPMTERIGYHDEAENRYYFYKSCFSDVCQPFCERQMLKMLDSLGLLIRQEKGKLYYKAQINKVKTNFYCISGEITNYL